MLAFFVGEMLSRMYGGNEMATDHLRPLFHAAPVTWWIAFGIWIWLGFHFLWPAGEAWLFRVVNY